MVKRFYLKLEHLATEKPIITSLIIGVLLPYLPNIVLPQEINEFLMYHKLNGFLIFSLLAFQIFTLSMTLFYFSDRSLKKHFLRKIDAVIIKLDSPFELEKAVSLHLMIKDKYYDSEMARSFEEYNQILSEVKSKWPKRFEDLRPLSNAKRLGVGGDWIPESELNGVKISFLQLKERFN